MATTHSLQKLSPAQVVESNPKPDIVVSLGKEHPADGLLQYLREASPSGLSNMFVKNAGELAERRRQLVQLLESWIDGLAIEKFIKWQLRQPRKVNGNGSESAGRRESISKDLRTFDPFFRPQAEAAAIRRAQTVSRRGRWAECFRRFGCIACGAREKYRGSGCCDRCYNRIQKRLADVEATLRLEAARERRDER